MSVSYSIAEARNRLPTIIRNVEESDAVELTRRGKPVAILLSIMEYKRLRTGRLRFWSTYQAFREEVDLVDLNIGADIFEDVRGVSPGREVVL